MREKYEQNLEQWNANMSILCNLEELFEMKMPKKRGERELEGLEDEEWREKLDEIKTNQ